MTKKLLLAQKVGSLGFGSVYLLCWGPGGTLELVLLCSSGVGGERAFVYPECESVTVATCKEMDTNAFASPSQMFRFPNLNSKNSYFSYKVVDQYDSRKGGFNLTWIHSHPPYSKVHGVID